MTQQQLDTLQRWHDKVVELATQYPDRTYHPMVGSGYCAYNPDERNPDGCIMGAAARALGYDTTEWDDKENPRSIDPVLVDELGLDLFDQAVNNRVGWFALVQEMQDGGLAWGKAVEMAKEDWA